MSAPMHMVDTLAYHACGGVILSGHDAGDGRGCLYCDRCGAYAIDDDDGEARAVPDGVDAGANRDAWEACDDCSPSAGEVTP